MKKNLYDGKYFYEVSKKRTVDGTTAFVLYGPMSTIRYISKKNIAKTPKAKTIKLGGQPIGNYKYVQVVNGRIVQAFTEGEILVTTKPLGGVLP